MALVRLHLTLIEKAGGRKEIVLDEGLPAPLPALLAQWGIPQDEVGIIVRNRRCDAIDCQIQSGDTVELFPILSGG
jgi:molybdopterin converting factor small subunit